MNTRQVKTYECRNCGRNIGSLANLPVTTGGVYATAMGQVSISMCSQHPQSMFAVCSDCETKELDNDLSLYKTLKEKMMVENLTAEEWEAWEHLPEQLKN